MAFNFTYVLLLLCLAICALQGVIQALTFLKEPADTTATEGGEVMLECSVDDKTAAVQWFKEQAEIRQDYVAYTILADGSLRILKVRKDDSGSYFCQAGTGTSGSITSRTITLTIQYICEDDFKIKSPGVVFRAQDLSLTCDCNGVPTPSYNWTVDGKAVDFHTQSIVIQNASVNASGTYRCFAKNPVKSVSSAPLDQAVIDGAPPRIIQPPEKQVVFVLRGEAMLNCLATGDPEPKVSWYFGNNQGPLRNTSVQHVFPNGSLHFQEVVEKNAGQYRCSATNKYDSSKSYKSKLVLAYIKDIPPISNEMVALGGTLSVACKPPEAVPKVTKIEWKLGNGSDLPDNQRIKVDGNKLKLTNTLKSNSGIYKCVAKNIAGQKSQNVEVVVVIYPQVIQNPQNQTIIEGQTAILECKFSGEPKPIISWEKNEKDLTVDGKRYKINGSVLTIETVSPDDNGLYRCSAKLGDVTERSKVAQLKIRDDGYHDKIEYHDRPDLLPEIEVRTGTYSPRLKFSYNPKNITIEKSNSFKIDRGNRITLECEVKGEKPWDITWAKVGLGETLPAHMRPEGNSLYIENSELEDTGNYTCTAKNSFSSASSVIVLNVYIYPVFVIKPKNVSVTPNSSALFHCKTKGYPEPTILWYENDGEKWSPVNKNDRAKVFSNGSLLLVNVQPKDSTIYRCIGGNAGSFIAAEAYLEVQSPGGDKGVNKDESDDMGQTVGIAVGCAAAYIILVLGLMIYCKGRRARRNKHKLVINGEAGEEAPLNEIEGKCVPILGSPGAKLQFPRQNLEALRTLGSSTYGNVFLAKATDIVEGEGSSIVVVQSLTTKDEKVKKEFMKTMEMLSLKHENIAKLLGQCEEEEPMYVISEYPEQGDLKTVMRDSSTPLTPTQKVNVCAAVASGMNYLTTHGHVHKDLAARNCLVDKSLNVKISFLSLNQGTYPKEYYRRNEELIPLRWMAPEALKGQFDDMSDVWSFGILMWEVYTEGLLPYEERSDNEVLKSVPYDLRLTKPEGCPGKIFKLMEQCWEEESEDRPTFGQLCEEFSEIPREIDF